MRRLLPIVLATTSLLSACASTGDVAAPSIDPAAARGEAFAARRCSGCHAIGLDGSPAASGPPFWQLQRRYNAIALQKRFSEISAHGSGEMPPIEISRSEAEDLVAYFGTLAR